MTSEVELFGDFDIRGVRLRISTVLGDEATVFKARLGDLTLGDVIAYLVGLAYPSVEVKLPPPWNALESVNLRGLELKLDVTHGTVGVSYPDVHLDLGFLELTALELTYGGDGSGKGDASVDLKLYGRLLDRTYAYPDHPLSWDLVDDPPPAVPPGGTPAFRLDYLGLGQRVTLRDPARLGDMASVIAALEEAGAEVPDTPDPLGELSTLRFDAAAGWLIGASFSVLGTLRLLAVFNDPTLYGLRLELSGERARKLAGLQFEILYRKVGPGLGVYHLELELPEAMRHLELGAASITLPYLVVDVWTNGNFMVDLGFPHGLDFSRSFTLQTFIGPVPVIGAGGFYFGALSSDTSTAVPRVTNGRFAPVLSFGIGLQIGVGRTIEMGVLRAGIVIALEGLLEGAVGFFEPVDRGLGSDVWYRVRGTLAIVGHIYGEIDFAIVKARVDIRAYASASITLEAYATTEVVLEAGVSAELRVKVAFFHIRLSFKAHVRQSMTLGRAGHPPWRLDTGEPAALSALRTGAAPARPAGAADGALRLLALEAPGAFGAPGLVGPHAPPAGRPGSGHALAYGAPLASVPPWRGTRVSREVRTLDLYLQPTVTVGSAADRPDPDAGDDAPAVQLLALLFMPRGRSGSGRVGFDDLAWAALRWALAAAGRGHDATGGGEDEVDRSELARAFHDLVADGDPERVGFCEIVDFLRENFQFRIRPLPADEPARAALQEDGLTPFPAPPWLTVRAEAAGHEADLQRRRSCSPAYRALVDAYFRRLHPDPPPLPDGGRHGTRAAAEQDAGPHMPPDSIAAFVFADAARLVLRGVLRAGLDAFGGWEADAREGDRLDDIARRYGVPGDDPVGQLALANQGADGFWAEGATLALADLTVRVREGESPADLAARAGVGLDALAGSVAHTFGLLRPGATVRVETGEVTTVERDTVAGLAGRFGIPVDALLAANPGLPWPPDPDGRDGLRPGETVRVPDLDVVVGPDDTPARIADRFGLSPVSLLGLPTNAGATDLLAAGSGVPLPSVIHVVAAGDTPASLAARWGLSVRDLVARADAGGAGEPVAYGRVRVPGCRRLPAEDLRAAMRDRGAFDAVAGALARFLLAGLRLPDPEAYAGGAPAADSPDWSGIPLFPLYVLTGQQWMCAEGDPAAERVTLRRNPAGADGACQRPLITFDSDTPDEALTVPLGPEEAAQVQALRPLAASGTPFDPQLLAATRAAPFVVVPRRFAVGEAMAWHAPRLPDWGQGADAAGDPVILPLPEALSTLLRGLGQPGRDPRLVVRPGSARGDAPGPPREIRARAWATRVQVEVRRAPDPARPGAFLPGVVEVFSTDGGGRRRLLELVEHLRAHPDRVARVHLLRASDPSAPGGRAFRSDALDPGSVVLLKTNLSTWTRPPSPLRLGAPVGAPPADEEIPVHASLAEPLPFLELLWEACVVAAGGFHLVYPVGPGGTLPDGMFALGDADAFTVLVVVSPGADSEASVAAEPFHDCVVSAESPADGIPFVEPPLVTVAEATSLPGLAEALGITPGDLALANASVVGLVQAGASVTLPERPPYPMQPGDDLLAAAMLMAEPSFDGLATALGTGAVIPAGTRAWTHPAWMAVTPILGPGRVGLRVVRTDPDPEPPGPAGGPSAQDDPATRLRALYNLLDARVERSGRFRASPRSLPVAPARIEDPDALNPVPHTPAWPWRYERVLGLLGLGQEAAVVPGDADPYAGIGGEARLSLRLLDVFGNRCLPDGALPGVAAPIRYTDALVAPGQWPGVAVSYRFRRETGPRLVVTASLDVARTSPAAGAPFEPVRERARADREAFAVVRRQLARDDVRIRVASSIDDEPQEMDRSALASFAGAADRWLATVAALVAGADRVRAGDTPTLVARRWRIPVDALAASNAHAPGLVAPGAGTLRVPILRVVSLGDTLAAVAGGAPVRVTPAALARRNRMVPLRPGAAVTAGGASIPVPAGATLASLAEDAVVEVEALGLENADVPDLFSPGTPLLLAMRPGDVEEGATLASLAARAGLGVADLLAANATNAGLFATGAELAIPDHVRPGEESAATVKVRAGDTLASVARRLGVEVGALVQANLALDGLLAATEPATVLRAESATGAPVQTRVLEGDTLATALHRLRAEPGCRGIDATSLARCNGDLAGLLAPGAVALAPPPGWSHDAPVAPDCDEVIFPLRAWLDLDRDAALVDPALPSDSTVRSVRTQLSPRLAREGTDGRTTHALEEFAADFQAAFPELRLATASGTNAGDGRVALFAVQLQNQTVSWRVGSQPTFFAPRPLLVTRWTTPAGQPVPIQPYVGGTLGPAEPSFFQGIDLDVWGRELLEAVDRFLGPEHSVTAQRLCAAAGSDAYDAVVRAKAVLAAAIAEGVEPVLDPQAGDPPADVEAAREAIHQRVLAELSEAYRIDAVVQLPVTVNAPFTDRAVAPRLYGRVVPTTYRVPEGATLGSVADDLGAPVELLARLIASAGSLLREGASVEVDGRSHTVDPADTLATVAAALEVDLPALARAVAGRVGLLRPGAPVDLVPRRHEVAEGDTLGSVIEALADGDAVADAFPAFADLNADVAALLRKGASVTVDTVPVREGDTLVSIARKLATSWSRLGKVNVGTRNVLTAGTVVRVRGASTVVREGDSLADVARALGEDVELVVAEVHLRRDVLRPGALLLRVRPLVGQVGPAGRLGELASALGIPVEDLVAALLGDTDLLRPGTGARWLARRPALTLSEVKVPLADGATLTFLMRTSSASRARRVALAPELRVTAVEYQVEAVPWAGSYQKSEWLTLVEPAAERLHDMDVPVPLRAHPVPPAILGQQIRRRVPARPELADLRRYDYRLTHAYERAAQDQLFFDVEENVPDAMAMRASGDPSETLPYLLARYHAVAQPLWDDLARLRDPETLAAHPDGAAVVVGAIGVFADLVGRTAAAWAAWEPPGAVLRPAGWAGSGPSALPATAPGSRPSVRVGLAGMVDADPVTTERVLTQDVTDLDAFETQNIRGLVRVLRNADLIPGRATNPAFVYRVPPTGPAAKLWPLLEHPSAFRLEPAPPDGVAERLAGLFGGLLGVTPDSPDEAGRDVRVSVTWLYPLGEGAPGPDGGDTPLLVEVPVALTPAVPFVPGRDLTGADGLCARLAARLARWIADQDGAVPAGEFRLDLAAYANLPRAAESGGAKPLVELRDVRLPVSAAGPSSPPSSPALRPAVP